MLKPTKHSHPDRTVISVALLLLSHIKEQRIAHYDALRHLAKSKVNGGDFLFLPAVNFLYLMGVIEYRQKTDAFEYVGQNETV